ncbi:hypothetical protein Anas_01939, partial [Armadillidium nasatum]
QSKHYSLLLQDDNDPGEHILSIHHDKIAESEEENNYEEEDGQEEDEDDDEDDDDDGFKSMIGEDEEQDVDEDEEEEDEDNEVGSDEEIFNSNQHRILANDNFRHAGSSSFGRKNDYHLLSNNEMNRKSNGLGIEPTLNAIWTPTPMSPVRRAFFLASIMFGVLVVAMFLWSIPCDVQPCGSEIKLKPRQWFTEVDYIGLNYSTLLEKINGDLTIFISFYKLDKITDMILKDKNEGSMEEPKYNISPSGCGLLSVEEKTGNLNWRVELEECPAHIKCDVSYVTYCKCGLGMINTDRRKIVIPIWFDF